MWTGPMTHDMTFWTSEGLPTVSGRSPGLIYGHAVGGFMAKRIPKGRTSSRVPPRFSKSTKSTKSSTFRPTLKVFQEVPGMWDHHSKRNT